MTLLLSNDDVTQALHMGDLIPVLEDAFIELAEGRGAERVRTDIVTPTTWREDGLYALKSMDGVIPKFGVGAIRINSDILTFPESSRGMRRVKVPAAPGGRYVGFVLLFSTHTGEPLAIFPDGVIQRLRVGGTSALAAQYLARQDASTVAILGSGWQAGAQLVGLAAVRKLDSIRVFSPSQDHREAFCAEMSRVIGQEIQSCATGEEACKGAHIIACASNAVTPVFMREWLEPGMHIGTIRPGATELDRSAWPDVDVMTLLHYNENAKITSSHGVKVGEDRVGSYNMERDDFHASLPTLPDIMVGRRQGRLNDGQVTSFFNNGMGYQFAAAGYLLYNKATELGLGRDLPTEWFTETVHP